nr:hypothetical protein [uncultured Clostridium sp.]
MNKFVKRCLIAGIILVVAGGAIAAAAVSYGANIWDIAPGEVIHWKNNTFSNFSFDDMDFENHAVETGDYSYLDFDEPAEPGRQIYTTGTANSLKAEIRAGRVFIKEDPAVSELTIYCNKEDGNWHIGESNGELELTVGGGIMTDDTDLVMIISVPKGYSFSEVDLEVSRKKGMLKRERATPIVACRSLSADDMNLEVKAGALTVKQANVNHLNIECSVGAVEYTGTTTGDINGECSVGAVKLLLSGKKEDYNYKVQSSLGAIKIADEQMAFVAGGDNWDYSADKNMVLDCSTGAIDVNFYQ